MTHVSLDAHPRPKRPWRERRARGLLRSPDRLVGIDMRSRIGREYKSAFRTASEEFPDAPADRVAEVARLRSIAALAEEAAITGRGTTDNSIRCANLAIRAARDLAMAAKGNKPDGAVALQSYLASVAAEDAEP
jgi:hypothetical protein